MAKKDKISVDFIGGNSDGVTGSLVLVTFQDKKILLGVSGGIAAYKTAHLVRLFIKAGAQVQVIMSPASLDFVTPLTLSTLSKNPVYFDFIE